MGSRGEYLSKLKKKFSEIHTSRQFLIQLSENELLMKGLHHEVVRLKFYLSALLKIRIQNERNTAKT